MSQAAHGTSAVAQEQLMLADSLLHVLPSFKSAVHTRRHPRRAAWPARKEELESEETRDLRRRHAYGAGDAAPAPAVVSLNGVIANLAVTEFMVMITGPREPRRFLMYHADRGIVNDRQDPRRPTCFTCGYLFGKREAANVRRYLLPG